MSLQRTSDKPIESIALEQEQRLCELATRIVKQAKQSGASDVLVSIDHTHGIETQVRMGTLDTLTYQSDKEVSLTLYKGKVKSAVSTTDLTPAGIQMAIDKGLTIIEYAQPDSAHGLADSALLARVPRDVDGYYPWEITPQRAIDLAIECEQLALEKDKCLVNSDGASVASKHYLSLIATSEDTLVFEKSTGHRMDCTLIASDGTSLHRDGDYSLVTDAKDLTSTAKLAEQAAHRSLSHLGARSLPSQKAPVLFTADVARHLFRRFIAAISGHNLYRQQSFLTESLGKPVFPDWMELEEQPYLPKAIGSAAFDNDGVATNAKKIIDAGCVKSYVLGSYTARKLGMQTTGNAGGVHNLLVKPNAGGFNELVKQMDTGLIITDVMGQGVNLTTGDYSRGVQGYWAERGQIQYPVHEVTIASNLQAMFMRILAVGNDIDKRGSIQTGSVLIEEMVVAGGG